jgi:hypothetical protein
VIDSLRTWRGHTKFQAKPIGNGGAAVRRNEELGGHGTIYRKPVQVFLVTYCDDRT